MNNTKEILTSTKSDQSAQPEVVKSPEQGGRRSRLRAKKYIPDLSAKRVSASPETSQPTVAKVVDLPADIAEEIVAAAPSDTPCDEGETKTFAAAEKAPSAEASPQPEVANFADEKSDKGVAETQEKETVIVFSENEPLCSVSDTNGEQASPVFIKRIFTNEERAREQSERIFARATSKKTHKNVFLIAGLAVISALTLILVSAVFIIVANALSIIDVAAESFGGGEGVFIGRYGESGNIESGRLYVSPISSIAVTQNGLSYSNGDTYVGARDGFLPSGEGIMTFADGDRFEGIYDGGEMVSGTYEYSSGDVYEGEFKGGTFHGQGHYIFSDGSVYIGSFENGLPHGHGTYSMSSGDVYEGDFVNGVKEGSGRYTWTDGTYYTGSFTAGSPNGMGTIVFSSGNRYSGEMVSGRMNGEGTYTYADGSQYAGTFKDDLMHGKGIMTFANGDVYIGEFSHGIIEGEGTYTWKSSGETVTGIFENGELVR